MFTATDAIPVAPVVPELLRRIVEADNDYFNAQFSSGDIDSDSHAHDGQSVTTKSQQASPPALPKRPAHRLVLEGISAAVGWLVDGEC